MKINARIIINDQATDGTYNHGFLLRLAKMGAIISAGDPYDEKALWDLSNPHEIKAFRDYIKKRQLNTH